MNNDIDQERQRLRQQRVRQMREENEAAIEQRQRRERERDYLGEMQPPAERREWQLPELEPEPHRRGLDTMPVDWSAVIDQCVSNTREYLLEVIAETVAELADRQREAIDDAMRPLKTELAELRSINAEQRVTIAEMRLTNTSTIDLPALPLRGYRAN
jgi:hypothetical protein